MSRRKSSGKIPKYSVAKTVKPTPKEASRGGVSATVEVSSPAFRYMQAMTLR
jgi:hypothetical protein